MGDMGRLLDLGLVEQGVALGPLTTYKAGGAARFFVDVQTKSALAKLVSAGVPSDLDILVVGRGSNLLVADSGFDGLAVKLGGEFSDVHVESGQVEAGGSAPLPRLARTVVDSGQTGLEFFVGVPGSVGGAVRQNAGCFGSETVDVLIDASVIDVRTGVISKRTSVDLGLGYRKSNLSRSEIVTDARFRLSDGDVEVAKDRMREVTRWRKQNQPGGTLNAGSVFKNPEGQAAGEIIDGLGLKGLKVGDVSVSTKHANFFVAGSGATASQIADLVQVVKDTVQRETGTILEPEIQFVGFDQ